MNKTYNPKEIEQLNYNWKNINKSFSKNTRDTYGIILPPPNITGSLHMGHAFQITIMDILIRYNKMSGKDILWQPGIDHAGIATQIVVEKNLNAQGILKNNLGREKFIQKIWEWKESLSKIMKSQIHRIGAYLDWDREKFTMDHDISYAVQKCFIKLYEDGLLYRDTKLVNWDPKLQTVISDLEISYIEKKSYLWYFFYPIVDSSEKIIVATSRPETIFGDVAVAVNPKDKRYKHLIGKMINLPLTARKIPIISDYYVKENFGTGCLKITPGHNFNDYEIAKKHNLPIINILNNNATFNINVPLKYQGLDRFKGRKKVIFDMKNLGFLNRVEPYITKFPICDRTGEILEPYITKQWFIKTNLLSKFAIKAVEDGLIRFIPDKWKNTYFSWMTDIKDWCISRQLWWGHRIPAWYDKNNNIYIGNNQYDVRVKYNLTNDLYLKQDEDVFDTWFSSAIWPFSSLGWPKNTLDLIKYYPTNVLVTGFDIIFFWVARMIMFGIYFMNDIPFKDIYITGLIRDYQGQKMSKSKGNVLDPIDIIDGISLENLIKKRISTLMHPKIKAKIIEITKKEFPLGIKAYGADAMRFTYAALSSSSSDINFNIKRVEGYRNFCNKLWNAARFIKINISDYKIDNNYILNITDKWIWSILNYTILNIHKYIKEYRFDLLANIIYDFVWNNYCDWYIEFAKINLYDKTLSQKQKNGVKYTLIKVLENILILSHPVIPFITERIYMHLKIYLETPKDTIIDISYPKVIKNLISLEINNTIDWLKNFIIILRNMKNKLNIKKSSNISLNINNITNKDKKYLIKTERFIKLLENVNNITLNNNLLTSSKIFNQLGLNIQIINIIDNKNKI